MITIHNEVTIDVGTMDDHPITLWLVSYGPRPDAEETDYWPLVVEALRSFCARQGWLLETGDDPYREKSLAVFAGGFGWPTHPHGNDEFGDEFSDALDRD